MRYTLSPTRRQPRLARLENTGRLLGERDFVERVGELVGRDLVPKARRLCLTTPGLTSLYQVIL